MIDNITKATRGGREPLERRLPAVDRAGARRHRALPIPPSILVNHILAIEPSKLLPFITVIPYSPMDITRSPLCYRNL